jgi:hypothetical protein
MISRAAFGMAPALAAIALAPGLGCDQLLGIHDVDAGPGLESGVGGDDGASPGSSGASSGGDDASSSGAVGASSGGSSSGGSSSGGSSSGSTGGGKASLGFIPSNFDPATLFDGGIDWSAAPDVTEGMPLPQPVTIAMNDPNATQADLYVLKSWAVRATSPITVSGGNPAIILVLTTVDIQGPVTVTAGRFDYSSSGPGVGQSAPSGGGAGASYCGVGGHGSTMTAPSPAGGATYGNQSLTPLLGGSAGGGGAISRGGGTGGGALQIIAGTSIAVRQYAWINAGGIGSGAISTGGGSGGAILLEAPSVTIAGNVTANGGGGAGGDAVGGNATADSTPAPGGASAGLAGQGGQGSAGINLDGGDGVFGSGGGNAGGGGGGAGRIRINTMTGNAMLSGGLVSPPLGSTDGGAACATQGTLGH